MDISVKAKEPGVYKNRYLNTGDVFLVEEKMFSSTWMEKLASPKPVVENPVQDKRTEARDPGEHDQHIAERVGLVPEPKPEKSGGHK